jgi:hypothetical protein
MILLFFSRENLQEEFILQAQALAASSSSMPPPQYDPLVHKCLFYNLILENVGEYI